MRRFFNALAVLTLVVSLSTPAYAAPRRDDGGDSFYRDSIQKIVQLIKKVVRKLDGGDVVWPKP